MDGVAKERQTKPVAELRVDLDITILRAASSDGACQVIAVFETPNRSHSRGYLGAARRK